MGFQMIMFHFSFGFGQHLCGPSGFTSEGRLAFLALQVGSLPESFYSWKFLFLKVLFPKVSKSTIIRGTFLWIHIYFLSFSCRLSILNKCSGFPGKIVYYYYSDYQPQILATSQDIHWKLNDTCVNGCILELNTVKHLELDFYLYCLT